MPHKPTSNDRAGQRFGRLTALRRARTGHNYHAIWLFRCDCGAEKEILLSSVIAGRTVSCGCFQAETCGNLRRKHGASTTPEWNAWNSMLERCLRPRTEAEDRNYKARGITVCDRWRESFANFFDDMGPRPSRLHSLDRIDNDGNYEPGNCRWATSEEQGANTRRAILLTMDGQTFCLRRWGREIGINHETLRCRYKRGWPVDRILTTPVKRRP